MNNDNLITDDGLTIEQGWIYTDTDGDGSQHNSAAIDIDARIQDKLKLDWDKFKGVDIKIGDEVITISKEEFAEVLFKLFPNLTPKFAAAILSSWMGLQERK